MNWLKATARWVKWRSIRARRRREYLAEQRQPRPDRDRLAILRQNYVIAIHKTTEAYRASRPAKWAVRYDVAAMSRLVLDHHNTECRSYRSVDTGEYADAALKAWARGMKYRAKATGVRVSCDPDLLHAILYLADHGGRSYGINCTATGKHRPGTLHNSADPCRAFDLREELEQREIDLLGHHDAGHQRVHDFDENEVHDHVWTGPDGP